MKTFKQYITEKRKGKLIDKVFGASLAFGAASGLLAFGKAMSNNNPQQRITNTSRNIASSPSVKVAAAKPAEEKKSNQYQFENDNVKKLYGALVSAEHRGNVEDPHAYDPKHYIRTKAGKGTSSAYGPLQITRNTARGYADPNNQYHTNFVAQGSRFLKSKIDDPVHGLGGAGTLSGEEHHANYQEFASHVMQQKAKELKMDINKPLTPQQLAAFTQHWRHGKQSGNQPESWYSATVNKYYNN